MSDIYLLPNIIKWIMRNNRSIKKLIFLLLYLGRNSEFILGLRKSYIKQEILKKINNTD